MPTIYVRLDPRKLDNPDTDLRYALPDLLRAKSCGEVKDYGYEYVGHVPFLLLFLKADEFERGLLWVLSVLEHETIFGYDLLQAAVVTVERNGQKVVEYPKELRGHLSDVRERPRTGVALDRAGFKLSETSRSLQPARQVNAAVRRRRASACYCRGA